ncbi:MAG: hypothetical protein J5633_10390 [Oscillospiraceae bacterium]|nr:hypothetical protein [Oscillospiraceae bacterium]
MKRGIAIILALAMTLSLEGCKRQTVWTAQLPSDAKHKASRGLETSCNPRIASDAEYTYVINYNDGIGDFDNEKYEIIRQNNTESGDCKVLTTSSEHSLGEEWFDEPFSWLTLSDDKLFYLLCQENGYTLHWISKDGEKGGKADISKIESTIKEIIDFYSSTSDDASEVSDISIEELLYKSSVQFGSGQSTKVLIYPGIWDGRPSSAWIADISNGTIKEWEHIKKSKEALFPIAFTGETIYYVKLSAPLNAAPSLSDLSLYAYRLSAAEEKKLCDLDLSQELVLNYLIFSEHLDPGWEGSWAVVGDSLYYPKDETLYRIDFTTGKTNTVCRFEDRYGFDWGILNDKIYFSGCRNSGLDENSLYRCDPDGGNIEIIASYFGDDELDMTMIGMSNGYLYYWEEGFNDPWYRRVSLENPALPGVYVHQKNEK